MKSRWGLAIIFGVSAVASASAVQIARGRGDEITLIALAAMLRDPLSLLAMRSPEGRRVGALLSSKPPRDRDAEPETAASEQMLPIRRELAPPVSPLGDRAPFAPEVSAPMPLEVIASETELLAGGLFGPEDERPPIGGALSPSRSPGSFGAGGGRPPLSAVPEIATWAMMILGFVITGVSIRREAARRARPKT